MADEECDYLTRQARRRLICSALLIVLAGFMIGWPFIGDERARGLAPVAGEPLSQEAKDAVRFLVYYWSAALLVLMVVLFVASWDFLATVRYGFSRHKQLEKDRRAMLEMEATKLCRRRQELN